MVSLDSPNRTHVPLRAYAALIALSVAAFCYVATETLPIGLLSLISDDLHVSLADTGLLVTGYAVTVCVVTLPLAYVTQRVPRRRLMAALLAILVAATLVTATAQNYAFLFSARVGAALTQALFWAVVAPAAAGMFPVPVRGRVTSVVFAGASLAPMLGVPAGTWLGQQVGWRVAFFALAGLAFLAFAAVALLMPTVPTGVGQAATGIRPNARRYWITVSVTALSVAGLFSAFTYTAVFLTDVAGFAPAAIGLLLLVRGLADLRWHRRGRGPDRSQPAPGDHRARGAAGGFARWVVRGSRDRPRGGGFSGGVRLRHGRADHCFAEPDHGSRTR